MDPDNKRMIKLTLVSIGPERVGYQTECMTNPTTPTRTIRPINLSLSFLSIFFFNFFLLSSFFFWKETNAFVEDELSWIERFLSDTRKKERKEEKEKKEEKKIK